MKRIREITLPKDIYENKILEDVLSKMNPRKDKVEETCDARNSGEQKTLQKCDWYCDCCACTHDFLFNF